MIRKTWELFSIHKPCPETKKDSYLIPSDKKKSPFFLIAAKNKSASWFGSMMIYWSQTINFGSGNSPNLWSNLASFQRPLCLYTVSCLNDSYHIKNAMPFVLPSFMNVLIFVSLVGWNRFSQRLTTLPEGFHAEKGLLFSFRRRERFFFVSPKVRFLLCRSRTNLEISVKCQLFQLFTELDFQ